ncbi:MAG: ABC transporter substrate-binding protein [Bacteroidales bacterium]
MKIYHLIFLLMFVLSCQSASNENNIQSENGMEVKYAQGFSIQYFDNYKLLTVKDPWQGANKIQYQYALFNNAKNEPELPSNVKKIKIPLKKIICLSTSHIAFIDVIDEIHSITAISGAKYINNATVKEKIDDRSIVDIGYENTLNYERIVELNPDLVITYGVGSEVTGYNQKLNDMGIETIIIPEYLENHPLGKLEWIKFIAAFYDKEEIAQTYFEKVENEYNQLIVQLPEEKEKPKVLFGLPWKDVWYVPGGKSFLAKMVNDAGGSYLWKDNQSRESISLNIENVFIKANNADIWLNTGTVHHREEILKIDERFKDFRPYTASKIYNNNLQENAAGGNNYWEKGVVEPHIILKDLIKIFHPGLLPNHSLVYYRYIE